VKVRTGRAIPTGPIARSASAIAPPAASAHARYSARTTGGPSLPSATAGAARFDTQLAPIGPKTARPKAVAYSE
jgi:hypothetical protein